MRLMILGRASCRGGVARALSFLPFVSRESIAACWAGSTGRRHDNINGFSVMTGLAGAKKGEDWI